MHKFIKNSISTTSFSVINTVFAIILSVIIARILGPENKGLFALALVLPTFLIAFLDMGTGPAIVYFIGKKKAKEEEIRGAMYFYWLLSSALSLLIGVITIKFFSQNLFEGVSNKILLTSLLIAPLQLGVSYGINFLLGKQRVYKYNTINTAGVIINLVFVITLMLIGKLNVTTAIFSQILAYSINIFLLKASISSTSNLRTFVIKKDVLKKFFIYGYKVYLGNLTSFFHGRIDVLILNYFMNPYSVGIYSIAVALSEKLWIISKSSSTILFAKVANERNNKKSCEFTALVTRNILLITMVAAAVLFISSSVIIGLMYGQEYIAAVIPFQILIIGTIPVSVSRIIANHFSGQGKPELNILLNATSVLVNVSLNLYLIPRLGVSGAAISSMVTYSLVAFSAMLIFSRINKIKLSDLLIIKKKDLVIYKSFANHLTKDIIRLKSR